MHKKDAQKIVYKIVEIIEELKKHTFTLYIYIVQVCAKLKLEEYKYIHTMYVAIYTYR